MDSQDAVDLLLVEDMQTDAELTLRALRKGGLGDAAWVRDGVEALDFLWRRGRFASRQSPGPRIVLLDVKMPRMSGLDVLRIMMADEALRLIPVVMFSSSAEERDVHDSYALGANSYVVKPLAPDDYDRVVGALGRYWARLNRIVGD